MKKITGYKGINGNDKAKIDIRELTFKHGLAYPSDEELIMLILGSGTKKMPVKALAKHVFSIIASSNEENLVSNLLRIDGMGISKALTIAAALELGKRMNKAPQASIGSPSEVIPFIKSYAMQHQEHFLCVSLNGAREIISIRVICVGSGNIAVIRSSDVFSEAIKEHASAVILCHNHPSGNPMPSDDDICTTMRLYQAAEILGITLLDHIIITKNSYFSFSEHDFLDEEKMCNLL